MQPVEFRKTKKKQKNLDGTEQRGLIIGVMNLMKLLLIFTYKCINLV